MVNISNNLISEIEEAMERVLRRHALTPDRVTKSEAYKNPAYGLSRRDVDNGIRDGWLRATEKNGKNGKQYIPIEDILNYREHLIKINKLKIK